MPQPHGEPALRPGGYWGPRHWAIIGFLLIATLTLGWLTRRSAMTFTDEATYLVLSQSLEAGHYRDEFLVGAPPHIQYPPVTPAWLLLVRKLAGPGQDAARMANILVIALTALLLGDALRRLGLPAVGVGAIAVVGLNPGLLRTGGTLFSEPLFTGLSMLAVWAALVADQGTGRRAGALAVVAAITGAMTRTIGVAVVAAIGGWAFLRRRWRLALGLTVGSCVVLGAWGFHTFRNAPRTIGRSYAKDLAETSSGFADRVVSNVVNYATQSLPTVLSFPAVPGTPLDNLLWLMLTAVCCGIGLVVLLRRWPAAALTLLGSVAIMLVWPWPFGRLLLPLIPLIVAAFLLGAEAIGRRFWPRRPTMLAWLVVTLLVLFAGAEQVAKFGAIRACHSGDLSRAGCLPNDERGMLQAILFARDSTPAETILVTGKPASVYLLSGRRTLPLRETLTGDDPIAPLRVRPAYLILSRLVQFERAGAMVPLLSSCRELAMRKQFDPSGVLLELRDTLSTGPDACAILNRMAADTIPDWSSPW